MNLSDEQKQTIAQRLADGESIADIQRLITSEFGVAMTFMETRFLLDDLNLDLKLGLKRLDVRFRGLVSLLVGIQS